MKLVLWNTYIIQLGLSLFRGEMLKDPMFFRPRWKGLILVFECTRYKTNEDETLKGLNDVMFITAINLILRNCSHCQNTAKCTRNQMSCIVVQE